MTPRQFFFTLILLASTYFLILLVTLPDSKLDDTSKIRFITLIFTNFLLLISIYSLEIIKTSFRRVLAVFLITLIITLGISISQTIVRSIEANPDYNFKKQDKNYEHIELVFLTYYFMLYMIAIFILLISGFYLASTQYLISWQEDKINKRVNLFLTNVHPDEGSCMICPICLIGLKDAERSIVEINVCHHAYHRSCLLRWMSSRTSCPMCRRDIFDAEEDRNVDIGVDNL